jgi:two-component system CheB/CheR fusion protein
MPRALDDTLRRYSLAVFSTMAATWVRCLLTQWVEDRGPFGLYFLSVLLTAWLAGTGPAFAALGLGVVCAAHFIMAPAGSLMIDDPADAYALAVYVIVSVAAILLFRRTASQHNLAEGRACENEVLSAELREADRRKDEFLALLAHELRNPLAPIRTSLELMDRSSGDPVREKALRRSIRRQLEQLVGIVDDLLDVSRFVRGRLELQKECVDLRDVVEIALETAQPLLDDKGHDIRFLRPVDPVYVRGDKMRLCQVVTNLLSNAAKYTPRHGKVRVLLDSDGGHAALHVVDNGIGISPEDQSRIFELFTQGDVSPTRDYGGLGLGLAIVRQLTAMHQGEVSVHSEGAGHGSRFTLTLPLTYPTPEELATVGSASWSSDAMPALKKSPEERGVRVLVVDDNLDAADTLAALLSFEGFATEAVYDGPAAVQAFEQFRPDIVLLDIGLPGMDGYEVAKRLRRLPHGRSAQIIAVTGWGGEEVREKTRVAEIDQHVVKPVTLSALQALLPARRKEFDLEDTVTRLDATSLVPPQRSPRQEAAR